MFVCYVNFLSELLFIGDKITANCFKDEITPSLRQTIGLNLIKTWH